MPSWLSHNYGCSQLGDDHENTKKDSSRYGTSPECRRSTDSRLGLRSNQPDVFREFLGDYDQDRVKFMVTQKVGDEYEEGMDILHPIYMPKHPKMNVRKYLCQNFVSD